MADNIAMPLISILVPLFNGADTLLFALASLQAQTCENWECVVVDDGSTDNPEPIIQAVCDPRIRYHRLERNRGRGYARQRALEIAQGKYIAFLDADDWIYPEKLLDQKQLLEAQPDVVLVSTGMAISNSSDQLVGVRNKGHSTAVNQGSMNRLGMPPLAFAPSMIVADLAQKIGFDSSFPISEDVDFLLRVLSGRRYAVLQTPLYVYREHGSVTFAKVNSALGYCCRMFAKQFDQHPLESAIEIAKARGKQGVYRAASALGLWNRVITGRSRIPDESDRRQYETAWQIVSRIAARSAVAV